MCTTADKRFKYIATTIETNFDKFRTGITSNISLIATLSSSPPELSIRCKWFAAVQDINELNMPKL
jgi:hypothetical protein